MRQHFMIAILIAATATTVAVAADDDPYLWLEDVEGEQALQWAKEKSAADTAVLEATPQYPEIYDQLVGPTKRAGVWGCIWPMRSMSAEITVPIMK